MAAALVAARGFCDPIGKISNDLKLISFKSLDLFFGIGSAKLEQLLALPP
jgi:hypothetical protein